MTRHEAKLALRVVARRRRVLELRRQVEKAERELTEAVESLKAAALAPVADQETALSVGEGR